MENKNIIEIEVEGKDKLLWKDLRPKFIKIMNNVLDTIVDHENNDTIKDELKQFSTALLKYSKEKLKRPGIENEKLLAEIEVAYAKRNKELAETRKINAEAQKIELENSIKSLRFTMEMMKATIIMSENKEDLIFIKSIESFLASLRALE